jgi:pimeloyl-ACP methyl ester carboxylesterase
MEATMTGPIEVRVAADRASLIGDLVVPSRSRGLVLFAHGSGSGRKSPRNQYVAGKLQVAGLATLLLDLLTSDEERLDLERAHLRFDIPFLADRLRAATRWSKTRKDLADLPFGYFGASTGAAAALVAAGEAGGGAVRAIVSRGGRPDLAGPALALVEAPTLLIVGGHDVQVLDLNRQALARLHCEKQLSVIPGASHLFEEPGALEEVARQASAWFRAHLDSLEWAPSSREMGSSIRGE